MIYLIGRIALILTLLFLQGEPALTGETLSVNGALVDVLFLDDGSYVVVTIDNWNRMLFFKLTYFNPALPKGYTETRTALLPNNLPPNRTVVKVHARTVHLFANWTVATAPNGQTIHYEWTLPSPVYMPVISND